MSTDKTSLGDRMKNYESTARFMPLLPIIARLDGKAFHTFCKGLEKPYDLRLNRLMVAVTKFLVEETQALMGYTQSDEITLVWYSDDFESQVFFDGRIAKMLSILAAMTTMEFNRLLPTFIPEKADRRPLFDCRVFQVPTLDEAVNCFLWRERDATKNSISAAGQANFSHKQLQHLNGSQIQEKLFQERGINWNDYPGFFKRGTFVQKRRVTKPFSKVEISRLPAKHAARTNPDLMVERWETQILDLPPFGTVTNRVAVIFNGADPIPDPHQETARRMFNMPPRSSMTEMTRHATPGWKVMAPPDDDPPWTELVD
jgi:tRNA(His) 5'-end guanylyltransferase